MQIAVALTDVASLSDDFQLVDGAVPSEYRSYALNEWDEFALEAAVQLVESGIASEVVTVTIGPERSEETIRKGLAKGADRAIRIWDEQLASAPILDSQTKSAALAGAVETIEADLVLTGVQTSDDMFGATGVQLAATLGYGWAAIVTDLDVDPDEGVMDVRRELEGGTDQLVSVDLPAVCTIQTGINDPRYASLRGIRMAQQAEIEVLDLDALGLSSVEPSIEISERRRPPRPEGAARLEGSATETAAELAEILRDRGVGT